MIDTQMITEKGVMRNYLCSECGKTEITSKLYLYREDKHFRTVCSVCDEHIRYLQLTNNYAPGERVVSTLEVFA